MKLEKKELLNLVTAAQNGDTDALGTLFESSYNDIYNFALATVKDKDLAENITQETCVEVMNTISNLRDPLAFNSWVRRITYHQCTRYFKKRKDVLVDENEDGETIFDTLQDDNIEDLPQEIAERKDLQDIIKEMLYSLPEEQRSAMMMYYFEEMSVKEIAEVQEVSEGTIKSRLNYGRKALMSSVNDYEKKNNIKLHAIPLFPLFSSLFKNQSGISMPSGFLSECANKVATETATNATTSIATETVKTVLEEGVKTTVGSVVKETVKKTAVSLGTKIIAGLIAAGIVTGSGATYVAVHNHNENTKIENQGVINGIIDQIKYESVDIYEDIEEYIVYDGYGGEATARVEFPQDYNRQVGDITIVRNSNKKSQLKLLFGEEVIGVVELQCSGENLSKGDITTVSGPVAGQGMFYLLEEKGYNLKSLTKDVTVPTLPVYITEKSQITKEHITEYMRLAQEKNPNSTIEGLYFATSNDPEVSASEKTKIFVLVQEGITASFVGTYESWRLELHSKPVLLPNGTIDEIYLKVVLGKNNYSRYEEYKFDDYMQDVYEEFEGYTIEKIS